MYDTRKKCTVGVQRLLSDRASVLKIGATVSKGSGVCGDKVCLWYIKRKEKPQQEYVFFVVFVLFLPITDFNIFSSGNEANKSIFGTKVHKNHLFPVQRKTGAKWHLLFPKGEIIMSHYEDESHTTSNFTAAFFKAI